MLLEGQEENLRIMKRAGAKSLFPFHEILSPFQDEEEDKEEEESFDDYIDQITKAGLIKNKSLLFSAHQMGTCRMSSQREDGVVDERGESWDVENLFIADGSVLPTSLGVNPMITIYALSYCIACNILKKKNLEIPPLPEPMSEGPFPSGPTLKGEFEGVDVENLSW